MIVKEPPNEQMQHNSNVELYANPLMPSASCSMHSDLFRCHSGCNLEPTKKVRYGGRKIHFTIFIYMDGCMHIVTILLLYYMGEDCQVNGDVGKASAQRCEEFGTMRHRLWILNNAL